MMSNNLGVPPHVAMAREAEVQRAVFLERFRISVARDLHRLWLLEEFKLNHGRVSRPPDEAARFVVSHTDALMAALGFRIQKAEPERPKVLEGD